MTAPVLFERRGHLGVVTLNQPRHLNALTFEMLELILAQVDDWVVDARVAQIALTGAGERGFCAGGDVAQAREAILRGEAEEFFAFLEREYRLDATLHEYPKPVVGFMDGLVFGGGIGLTAHASHRIVTERSRLAMPEVRIGFVPDAGGSLRLAEMPGEVGMHLGLTAGMFGAGDAIAGGFADVFVSSARLPDVLAALEAEGADEVLARFAEPAPAAELIADREWIDAAYAQPTVPGILAELDRLATEPARAAAASIREMSPFAVCVTHRVLREARAEPGLRRALEREFQVARPLTLRPDFCEGVRARLVDKDGAPRWSPARVEDVDAAEVEALFAG